MNNQKINQITILNYFKRQVQKNITILKKLHEILLFIIVMPLFAMCLRGIITEVPFMTFTGMFGAICYVPLWDYVGDVLYKIGNK